MRRTTLICAVIGSVVAAATIKILVLPHWIALFSGPLFAVAVLLGTMVVHRRRSVTAAQYGLMALLYSASHIVLVPLVWNVANVHVVTPVTLVELGPTIGMVAAGAVVLALLPVILRRPGSVIDRSGVGLATLALMAGEIGAALLEWWGRFYRFGNYQPATASLMASFAALCGYVGHRLGKGEHGDDSQAAA